MPITPEGTSIQELLRSAAHSDPENFNVIFGRLRKILPDEVTEACLVYIAQNGLDSPGYSMAFWLSLYGRYLAILFDPSALPTEVASKALAVLKNTDMHVFRKFLKAADQIVLVPRLLRALSLVPTLGDFTALLPWLRKLTQHGDERVRSRAVKLLCELRPNSTAIHSLVQEPKPRVRANAIEALWNANVAEAASVFKAAASDTNHRVAANALVGLHLQHDPAALPKIIELSESPDHLFRTAMAWCLGFIADERGLPTLQRLSKDPSVIVRKRAARSLLMLPRKESMSETAESPLPLQEVSQANKTLPTPSFAMLS
jgi:HEAT repeat protein